MLASSQECDDAMSDCGTSDFDRDSEQPNGQLYLFTFMLHEQIQKDETVKH